MSSSMGERRTTVLFIAGSGRSGSTLLDNILGQVDGYFSVGEVRYIWGRGILEKRLCGCGRRLLECEVWCRILDDAYGGVDDAFAESMLRHQNHNARARRVPAMAACRRQPARFMSRLGDYPGNIAKLYRSMAAVTGARVIVDSSKLPAYGWLLGAVPSIDLRIVHLVRDPRAAAYSWMRKKVQPDRGRPGYMEPQSPLKSAMLWNVWNASAELFWRRSGTPYLRLRYEDLVRRPYECVREILDMLGEGQVELPFVDNRTVQLRPNHTVAGNPNRLQAGRVVLKADAAWITGMPRWARLAVTSATTPLLLRYGYHPWQPDSGYTEPSDNPAST